MSLYRGYFVPTNFDPTGKCILAGCGIGAAWSGGTSIAIDVLSGNGGDVKGTCCRAAGAAVQGCIVGGTISVLGPAVGITGGFAIGCVAAVIGKFLGDALKYQLGCGDKIGWCDLIQSMMSCVASGGVAGTVGGGGQMTSIIKRLLGFDIAVINRMCSDGVVVPPVTNKACCTYLDSNGRPYEKTVDCAVGRDPNFCCTEKASNIFGTWEVVGATAGSCQ